MFQAFHRRTKRLDYWDVKMAALASLSLGILITRFYPELLDIHPWWWGTLFILLILRPLYHFWIEPSNK